ncbi:chemotaxis protein CheW [Alteromonas sp. ASW11-19]|uniref:Chemotaxis protein CheW n=1 Tax=Alteromonas salexigens TaxID=2982530 RepID=A0ABT2VS38_9ALTE|nr:chemotaxis protein CheW [Alteromonas salexigens]MCU7555041.1 chemotaxis protein CheW [Alteromonas salexigens]
MSKGTPFAREDVMEDYLNDLLRAPEDPADVVARTAKLLEQAAVTSIPDVVADEEPAVAESVEPESVTEPAANVQPPPVADEASDNTAAQAPTASQLALRDSLDEQFQALFFEVAGLTLAVPLTTLGGIHRLEKIGPLFGKPKWFKGVMLHRDEKLNVVDTAQWVMPEKYDEKLAQTLNYQYLIMLGDSAWGLASDKLVNTVTLTKTEVQWRAAQGKRPWLAGMVKEKMCALVDVHQLISMLNNGLGSNDQTP